MEPETRTRKRTNRKDHTTKLPRATASMPATNSQLAVLKKHILAPQNFVEIASRLGAGSSCLEPTTHAVPTGTADLIMRAAAKIARVARELCTENEQGLVRKLAVRSPHFGATVHLVPLSSLQSIGGAPLAVFTQSSSGLGPAQRWCQAMQQLDRMVSVVACLFKGIGDRCTGVACVQASCYGAGLAHTWWRINARWDFDTRVFGKLLVALRRLEPEVTVALAGSGGQFLAVAPCYAYFIELLGHLCANCVAVTSPALKKLSVQSTLLGAFMSQRLRWSNERSVYVCSALQAVCLAPLQLSCRCTACEDVPRKGLTLERLLLSQNASWFDTHWPQRTKIFEISTADSCHEFYAAIGCMIDCATTPSDFLRPAVEAMQLFGECAAGLKSSQVAPVAAHEYGPGHRLLTPTEAALFDL